LWGGAVATVVTSTRAVRDARIASVDAHETTDDASAPRGLRLATSPSRMPPNRSSRSRVISAITAPIGAAIAMTSSLAAAEPEPSSQVVGVVQPRPTAEATTPAPVRGGGPGGELTAADVAAQPIPGFESGRVDGGEDDSALRVIGRGALFLPKLAFDAVLSPFRFGVWANDRYHVIDWYDRIFYNDAKTFGIVPTLSVDTTLGVTAGARLVHSDLFGDHEGLGLQATVGSRYRQVYAASLNTGERLGKRFSMKLDVGYERRPHDVFYGIGNGDRIDAAEMPPPGTRPPIDPRFDSTAIQAYYRQDRSRASLRADLHAVGDLHLRAAGAISEVSFGPPDENTSIADVYDTRGVIGFGGVQYGYGELELRWDSRRAASTWEPPSVHSTGSLAAVYGGRMHRLDTGPDFWRYGVDLERFIRLTDGPRVLIARFHGEGVTGSRDEVPFTELPRLGGSIWLRGYATDQFRDRIAAFGSVAYEWDLSQWFSARLFTDVGRVYPSLDELSVDHLRMGYGIGIEAHSVDNFLLEASLGSSIDGGLFLNLSFNPVYDLDDRVRRR
jgi:hypothetical protein